MSISARTAQVLPIALADSQAATELIAAIDAAGGSFTPAAGIATLGVTTDLTGVDGTASNAADLATTESRLDAIEAKIDALLGALVTAGLMVGG